MANCTKCQITMAHKKHHKKHAHKRSSRRARVGAFSKSNVMDVAVTGASAAAGYYIADMLVSKVAPAGTDPLYANLGKIAVGVAAGAFAPSGTLGKVVLGLGVGMVASGGEKIAKHYIDGTPMIAGTINTPVIFRSNTVAGYGHRRIAGGTNSPVLTRGNTINGAMQRVPLHKTA